MRYFLFTMVKLYLIPNDDKVDQDFGKWLRSIRTRHLLLGYFETADLYHMTVPRYRDLEQGTAWKGVTKRECLHIANALNIPLKEVLRHALGK